MLIQSLQIRYSLSFSISILYAYRSEKLLLVLHKVLRRLDEISRSKWPSLKARNAAKCLDILIFSLPNLKLVWVKRLETLFN